MHPATECLDVNMTAELVFFEQSLSQALRDNSLPLRTFKQQRKTRLIRQRLTPISAAVRLCDLAPRHMANIDLLNEWMKI